MQFVIYNKSRARQHRNSKFEKKVIKNEIMKWFVYILFRSKNNGFYMVYARLFRSKIRTKQDNEKRLLGFCCTLNGIYKTIQVKIKKQTEKSRIMQDNQYKTVYTMF